MLASLLNVDHLVQVAGYPLLFVLVMGESSGVPIPGETALITAAVLASRGKLQIELRDRARRRRGDRRRQHRLPDRAQGRALAARAAGPLSPPAPGRPAHRASRSSNATVPRPCSSAASCSACACGRRGSPAPRACTGARSSLWNALGGICWATAIGLLAYFLGNSAGNAIETFGIYGLVAALVGDRQRGRSCTAARAGAAHPSRTRRAPARSDAGEQRERER